MIKSIRWCRLFSTLNTQEISSKFSGWVTFVFLKVYLKEVYNAVTRIQTGECVDNFAKKKKESLLFEMALLIYDIFLESVFTIFISFV